MVEAGNEAHAIEAGQLPSELTTASPIPHGFRARLKKLEIAHRRGGYRDPEPQAFIELGSRS